MPIDQVSNSTERFRLAAGKSLVVTPFSAGAVAVVALTTPVAGIRFTSQTSTSAQSVGPFSASCELIVSAVGTVDVETVAGTLSALVSGAWNRVPSLATTMACAGDSFTANWSVGVLGGMTFTRADGVVTVTGATGHQFYPGALITVYGMVSTADEVSNVAVSSRISSTSFTYPQAGSDGVLAQVSAAGVVTIQSHQSTSILTHMNRLTGGAYKLVAQAGAAGRTSDHAALRVATKIAPVVPQRVVWMCGYNDLTSGYTAAQSAAYAKQAVDAYPQALWDVFSIFPFNSGAANNTAAKLREVMRSHAELKAVFAGYQNVRVHNSLALFGLSTGLAKTGYINASDFIHPTTRCCYEIAKYLVTMDATSQPGLPLDYTGLDVYANDAASKCMIDNSINATQVAATAPTTGFMPTGVTLSIAPALAVAAAGTVTANARADGFGNDFILTYTPDVATTVQVLCSIPVARFTSGQVLASMALKMSVIGIAAGNVVNVGINFIAIADGITYSSGWTDSSGGATAAVDFQQEDIVDRVISLRDLNVPQFASLTTLRMDVFVKHAGAGSAMTIKMAQRQVRTA